MKRGLRFDQLENRLLTAHLANPAAFGGPNNDQHPVFGENPGNEVASEKAAEVAQDKWYGIAGTNNANGNATPGGPR